MPISEIIVAPMLRSETPETSSVASMLTVSVSPRATVLEDNDALVISGGNRSGLDVPDTVNFRMGKEVVSKDQVLLSL